MRLAWLILVALLLAGCPYPNHRHDLLLRSLPEEPAARDVAITQTLGMPLEPGNGVELVMNGRVFDVIEEEIRAARTSIHLASYIWRPGIPSDRLLIALRERRPGVQCRVLVDPLGSVNFEVVAPVLVDAGCEVRLYRSLQGTVASLDADRIRSRMHRKLVIRDGEVGLTGGFGIWRSWLGNGDAADTWRDTNVRLRGPAVRGMQLAFAQNWQEAGGDFLPPEAFPPLTPAGDARACFVASTQHRYLSQASKMWLLTIASAKHRLWVANSYFIPPKALSDALIEKARQGVDVRVLVPGRYHDVKPVLAGQRAAYAPLLEAGVRIWEYEVSMMHAKTMLADDTLSVVGSTNFDPLSLNHEEEGSVLMEDPVLAKELEVAFEQDLTHSVEIHWKGWKRRGALQKLGDRLIWLIGDFL
ncbi:phosphatidylserine/phosphatidylglycerophosphate/cardiolipin synthase family protein [Corallococcus sp. CA053C]|uniref:phospholipase D-like domain-containing protein n=1 Tax=Corallococcus sp. CA053C TaxID=2316732 RepID=UPI000EA31C8F|nr:phosphatidylserine/phosphatidylglycerophosphate/cardiolipin synthase family protein [Corallococcus sp. CA053C]RKH09541.1 phosphatidylserine/phosphatidylglycerophosphate/cardiolipin synthase family protein [Corallococcus sp. CA053C]